MNVIVLEHLHLNSGWKLFIQILDFQILLTAKLPKLRFFCLERFIVLQISLQFL